MPVITLVIVGMILFILNHIYINTNEYKLRCGDHIRQFRKLPMKDLDGIVIGSAQAYYGFDFPREGYNIENLSWAPQELQMCCYIAKENLFRIKKGGVLLVCFPFVGGVFPGYSDWKHQEAYYSILKDPSVINGYNHIKALIYKHLPLLGSWKNTFRFLRDIPRKENESVTLVKKQISCKMEERIKDWEYLTGVNICRPHFTETHQLQICKNMDLLNELFVACQEQEIFPVIITPPVIDDFYQLIAEEFWTIGYMGPLYALANKTGVSFVDFCGERLWGNKYDFYMDIDFMNHVGRKKLTREVIQRLKGMGLLK